MYFSDCTGAFCGRHIFKLDADFTHDVIQQLLVAVTRLRGDSVSLSVIVNWMSSHEPLSFTTNQPDYFVKSCAILPYFRTRIPSNGSSTKSTNIPPTKSIAALMVLPSAQ
jgi:hypothetical protein